MNGRPGKKGDKGGHKGDAKGKDAKGRPVDLSVRRDLGFRVKGLGRYTLIQEYTPKGPST